MFKARNICNKNIYIVEDHHHVLETWAIYRKSTERTPLLITLDHHTDCLPAFNRFCSAEDNCRTQNISKIDYRNNFSIQEAIKNLKHDEHIDAAIKANIIEKAFVINYDAAFNKPSSFREAERIQKHRSPEGIMAMIQKTKLKLNCPKGFPQPEDGMYILKQGCWIDPNKEHPAPHDDTCVIPHYDQAIESIYLEDKLSLINEMCPDLVHNNLITQDYILDIDLDYFHTFKSITPSNTDLFYNLIRNAKCITIAIESVCVDMLKADDDLNSDLLLEQLLDHITNALQ